MNIVEKFLGVIFPPYKFRLERKYGDRLYKAIINSLPDRYEDLKDQSKISKFDSFNDWVLYPGFKFISKFYPGESYKQLRKRGINYRLSGIQIFSKKENQFLEIELLIIDNLISGIKIGNNQFGLSDLDIDKINSKNTRETTFEFKPGLEDEFYNKLPDNLKSLLRSDILEEVEFNGRIFYSIFDLEDGNCIALDKKYNLYSLVHDASPVVKKMNISTYEFLEQINNNSFDQEKHLEERYKSNK